MSKQVFSNRKKVPDRNRRGRKLSSTQSDYPHDRCTRKEFAALNRAANKTHKKFSLTKGDTIILSASIVPGNELAVARLKDNLARQGVKIVSYRTSEETIHATGHGNQEDIKWLLKTHPKFFIPIHGSHYMLTLHKELAMGLGMSEENIIVPDNGSVIEIQDEGKKWFY